MFMFFALQACVLDVTKHGEINNQRELRISKTKCKQRRCFAFRNPCALHHYFKHRHQILIIRGMGNDDTSHIL